MQKFISSNIPKIRRDYSKIKSIEVIPDLIEMQKKSYDKFLQLDSKKQERQKIGLQNVLATMFPIYSNDAKLVLEFVEYNFDNLKYNVEECKQRGVSYGLPLISKFRLITNEVNEDTGTISVKDIKEQDVYLCDIPLITSNGSFVINGTERVIVSQIYRSPGVFFDHDKGKTNINGKLLYSASIIPHRGSWLDFEFDSKDTIYVRIDKRKKFPVTTLLRALDSARSEGLRVKAAKENKTLDTPLVSGMSTEEILATFYEKSYCKKTKSGWIIKFIPDFYKGKKLTFNLINATDNTLVIKADTPINHGFLRKIQKLNVSEVIVPEDEILGRNIANNIMDVKNAILIPAGAEITKEVLAILVEHQISEFEFLLIDNITVGPYILNTLLQDKNDTRDKALEEIYKVVKSAEASTNEVTEELFHSLFFNNVRYDLSEVGRVKINERFAFDLPEDYTILTKHDIIAVIKHLISIKDGKNTVDDIDHLGNRRIRSIGELLEGELRNVLVRLEKSVKEKMVNAENSVPGDLINVKLIQAIIREFFGTSQLSQFMDQTNPLSEVTHKRRLSALGPKGLARDRASFEVRDVHLTHYGRICPIETPEGPNIGLINSMALYARVNKYGFLETPYNKVENGKVLNEIHYMTASQEGDNVIAQATANIDVSQYLTDTQISCRKNGEFILCAKEEVNYMDVSPKQLVSVAASLIPFLENDDANRALMGSNMQRQAVPLLKPEAPFVGTGMEAIVAKDSGSAVIAKRAGYIYHVDSSRVVIRVVDKNGHTIDVDIYSLKKFQRSNHNTCVNQTPLVRSGMYIQIGDIIADGPSTELGELALGKNILVAFMPWNGYNFEDSILVSERIVREDVFTSIHIEEFEVLARDTKLGAEEITSDIPNVGEDSIKSLDEAGVVIMGAEVKPGDILVGKVTPKAENVVTPEEKLLRAIFGEKASDVRDTSLKVPSGVYGTVIGVRVFSRRGIERDSRSQAIERKELEVFSKDREDRYAIIEASYKMQILELLEGQVVISAKALAKGSVLAKDKLEKLSIVDCFKITVNEKTVMQKIDEMQSNFEVAIAKLQEQYQEKISHLQKGDDLPSGVLKMVKVFIAVKRKLQPGDKMAGRHGNKGVVSKILAIEDMPYLEDGTPVDMCLNPLGVPSRMNMGQILEVHLGYACANVGKEITLLLEQYRTQKIKPDNLREYLLKVYGHNENAIIQQLTDEEVIVIAEHIKKGLPVATPVFDGAKESDINNLFELCKLDTSGQVNLVDGRTGETFERKVTVGYMYMLKLHHLVDDKIHARSIGPYSLITQQPLGGKAQFGGQRFGEMEVWALEAYGAAYTLQEMLTVKSDDQAGRTRVYESIIRGDETFKTGIPESFNVLVKELRSLCLDLDMKKN